MTKPALDWSLATGGRTPRRARKAREPSSAKNEFSRLPTVLPANQLQFWNFTFILRIAEAKISDQAPVRGDIKNLADGDGIED